MNDDYNNDLNWSSGVVPTGVATFGPSSVTDISVGSTTAGGWVFNAGAPAYTLSSIGSFDFTGIGIQNDSGSEVTFNPYYSVITFRNAASAGNIRIYADTGRLDFNDTSTAGTARIWSNNQIYFNQQSTAGNASIELVRGGNIELKNSASAGRATITTDGSFAFYNTSSAGRSVINNSYYALFFDTSNADNARITNTGSLTFLDASSAGSSTLINIGAASTFGSLYFRDSSTADRATIFTGPMALTLFSDVASGGAARMIISAGGTIDFSLLDSGTTVGSIEGAGTVALGSRALTVGSNNLSTAFSGVISDGGLLAETGGSLSKTGSGTLILSGNNAYTGATIVSGGRLVVDGSIASSSGLTVEAGSVLGGNGSVPTTIINANGFLAPGNSIGTLNVQGNLTLAAAASYMVEVDPANADRTNVTGAANLGGATVNASFAPGSYVARQYTILNATGGLGGSTFGAQVNTNLPTNFTSNLSYDANNAYLNLALQLPSLNGLNGNQTNVGNALVNSFNAAGGIPLVFGALTPQGLTQVSGEAATGSQQTTFDAMGQFVNVLTDPFMGTRAGGAAQGGGASAYADEDQALAYAQNRKRNPNDALAAIHTKVPIRATIMERLWSVWGAGYGGTRSTDGNPVVGSNDTRSRVYGAAAGVDYRLTSNTIVGFALGGAGTNFNVAGGLGNGRSEMFQAGLYGRHMMGAAYVSGALAYGWQDVTTDRNVFGNAYRANFNASALTGRVEGGWRFATSATSGLTPYAAGQVTGFFLPSYAEQTIGGVNTFALSYAQKDVTASRSELGLRGDTSFAMQDAILTLRGRAAWAHNFDTDRSINAIFQTLPASGFTVNGAAQARNAALLSAGGEIRWASGFSIAGTFEGEFSRNVDSYAGKGIVRYQW